MNAENNGEANTPPYISQHQTTRRDVFSTDQLISFIPGLAACPHGGHPAYDQYMGSTLNKTIWCYNQTLYCQQWPIQNKSLSTGQTISFAVVRAYHQNGITEKHIGDLTH